jgi:hypothetical protein
MGGRWMVLTLSATLLFVVPSVVAACQSTTPTARQSTGTSPRASPSGSAPTSTGTPTGPSSATLSASPSVPLITEGYVPLFPFISLDDAQAWQRSYREGGHQPWHLDAGQTALAFTRGFLGFTDIELVTTRRTDSDGAHIGVGYRNPAGRVVTAAVLHLMRFGIDREAPWEVVGSDDTTFTLDRPDYASHVTSPLWMGGLITGVDENLSVAVRQLGTETPLGRAGPIPAGGQAQPWSLRVIYSGARPGALALVAATGGHVQQVERFAITGVYSR